ncbi:hypothetical protein EDD16DRAFT_1640815 [Pisolithus croceorrhizus]|nr:hypothetical protein EDD16DRAFT_1640815 [Pisolithus croceorrhizus]KAI6115736.1 hypothetical protein EV401DRAFT_56359 [Pisolithus croceorrhizus]
MYTSGEDRMTSPARSHSEPTAESSQGPSFGRRTQSEISLCVPAPIYPPTSTDNLTSIQRAAAPSPVPTEIIPTDLTAEDIVEDIQRMGIKVRDFAYEPIPQAQLAPELFDPIMAYNYYEDALANTDPQRPPYNGRNLRRLIDLGWVSEAADRLRWQKKDIESLEAFDSRPHYPWKAYNLLKPTKDKLKEVARARLQFVHGGQWPPEVLARGLARIGGFLRQDASSGKRPADSAEAESQPEGSPPSKKLRLLDDAPADSQAQSTSVQHAPLALVNGKAPQQFPAGRLPENTSSPVQSASKSNPSTPRQSPERSSPDPRIQRPFSTPTSGKPPKQYPAGYPSDGSPRSPLTGSPVGRPLQRQQTMPSLYPTDLTRSDSRTVLTESAKS